jgi:hypothetical protein
VRGAAALCPSQSSGDRTVVPARKWLDSGPVLGVDICIARRLNWRQSELRLSVIQGSLYLRHRFHRRGDVNYHWALGGDHRVFHGCCHLRGHVTVHRHNDRLTSQDWLRAEGRSKGYWGLPHGAASSQHWIEHHGLSFPLLCGLRAVCHQRVGSGDLRLSGCQHRVGSCGGMVGSFCDSHDWVDCTFLFCNTRQEIKAEITEHVEACQQHKQ